MTYITTVTKYSCFTLICTHYIYLSARWRSFTWFYLQQWTGWSMPMKILLEVLPLEIHKSEIIRVNLQAWELFCFSKSDSLYIQPLFFTTWSNYLIKQFDFSIWNLCLFNTLHSVVYLSGGVSVKSPTLPVTRKWWKVYNYPIFAYVEPNTEAK